MQGMGIGTPTRKWYYLIWPTYRHRPVFKIPGTARICEQLIRRAISRPAWRLDCVAVRPDAVHLLVHAPSSWVRTQVQNQLRDWVTTVIRQTPAIRLPHGRLWGHGAWCGVLLHARSVRTARQRISRMATPSRPLPQAAEIGNLLVRQEPASRVHDIDRLRQDVVL